MFGKKECVNCGKKSSKESNFCNSCGFGFGKEKKDLGLLGENDLEEGLNVFSNSLFGKLGEKMIFKMFESTAKMLEKEMRKQQNNNQPRTTFQLFINGQKVPVENKKAPAKQRQRKVSYKLPSGDMSLFQKLPKQDPETNVRRFSDKIVYEITMPGISSEKDISIVELENSIEIKAVGKNAAYRKIIPVNFPITGYGIYKGKLILELDTGQ
jgi:HSP20 family molecular chaperone IbpA